MFVILYVPVLSVLAFHGLHGAPHRFDAVPSSTQAPTTGAPDAVVILPVRTAPWCSFIVPAGVSLPTFGVNSVAFCWLAAFVAHNETCVLSPPSWIATPLSAGSPRTDHLPARSEHFSACPMMTAPLCPRAAYGQIWLSGLPVMRSTTVPRTPPPRLSANPLLRVLPAAMSNGAVTLATYFPLSSVATTTQCPGGTSKLYLPSAPLQPPPRRSLGSVGVA